jgi:hypothetical protein
MRASLFPLLPLLLATATTVATVPALAAAPDSSSSASPATAKVTHVLGFAANDHFDHADALTKALKQVIASSTNARLGEGDFSLEVLTAALGCNDVPDAACLKKISNKTQSNRFIWGTLTVDGQKVQTQLYLFEDGSAAKKTQFSYQANLKDSLDEDLPGLASKAVSELLEPLTYRVVVRTQTKEGTVLVDGKVAGSLKDGEATLEVTSGKHVFRLETDGGTPVEETARVRVDGTTKVRLDATALPEAGSNAPPVAREKHESRPLTEPPVEESNSGGSAQRTWGYITLGVGGALLVGGGLAAGRLYQINNDDGLEAYRSGLRPNEDACTEADNNRVVTGAASPSDVRSLCSEGKTMELAQIILLAGGVVAAGTGLTLLLTSKSTPEKTANALVLPRMTVGKDRTFVGLALRF